MKKVLMTTTISVAFATSFSSCKKDSDNKPTIVSKVEASSQINSSSNRLYNDIVDMTQADGIDSYKALNSLMNSSNTDIFQRSAEGTKTEKVLRKVKKFRDFFIPQTGTVSLGRKDNSSRLDFSSHLGVYEWNKSTKSWDTVSTTNATNITLKFPSDTTSNVNDAELIINKYSDIAITDNGTTDYYPTEMEVIMNVKSIKKGSISLNASYSDKGRPKTINANIYVSPFTFIEKFNVTGNVYSINTTIDKDNESGHIFSEGAMITLTDNSDTADVKKIENGYIQARDLKVLFNADIEAMNNDNNTSITDKFNNHANAILVNNNTNAQLGVFKMKETDSTSTGTNGTVQIKSTDLYIIYNDGTSEKAEDFFQKHIDKLKDFFTNEISL